MRHERWKKLMDSFSIPENKETYTKLVSCYSEKHGYYHSSEHIEATLSHLNTVRDLADKPNEIELALWFHDAIYKIFSTTNELDSANWCSEFLIANVVEKGIIERVHRLIMATIHSAELQTKDEKLMVDIDLSILGAEPKVYDHFEHNVRKEYRFIPYFLYRKKRKEILNSFLEREQVYSTDYFYNKWEANARNNLNRAISNL